MMQHQTIEISNLQADAPASPSPLPSSLRPSPSASDPHPQPQPHPKPEPEQADKAKLEKRVAAYEKKLSQYDDSFYALEARNVRDRTRMEEMGKAKNKAESEKNVFKHMLEQARATTRTPTPAPTPNRNPNP